ncbi:MAG: hypothetical protein RR482_05685, partial [Clostridia bacterium]
MRQPVPAFPAEPNRNPVVGPYHGYRSQEAAYPQPSATRGYHMAYLPQNAMHGAGTEEMPLQETRFYDAGKPRRDASYYNKEYGTSNPAVPELLAGGECGDGEGILELHPDGYGFLRTNNYQAGPQDVYVSMAQIRRFGLKNGDRITGKTRPTRDGDRYSALLYIHSVNDIPAEEATRRKPFDELTPVYPSERLTLENADNAKDLAIRVIDFIAPIVLFRQPLQRRN